MRHARRSAPPGKPGGFGSVALEVSGALGVNFDSGGLKEECGAAVQVYELPWINLRHLEDEDACADNEEAEYDGHDLCCTRFETLIENNRSDKRAESEHLSEV